MIALFCKLGVRSSAVPASLKVLPFSLQVEEENKPFCSLPDLANSTDFHEFEKFVTSAHALVRTWLALELVSRLERFVNDPLESPAIVIRGLPVDAYVPPTEKDCLLRKAGNYASETLLVGISRIVGQPFQMGYPDPSSSEMEILIRDIYSIPEHDNEVHYSHRRDCVSEFPHVVSCRIPNMSSKP
ncbi:unnamed protein product [Sphagnum jensenii]|uniref:Uncharacterized protein n=1 Tax=Sphagnum jensenii TaxID=128206 RepID=A0ABP1C116_9BRYO